MGEYGGGPLDSVSTYAMSAAGSVVNAQSFSITRDTTSNYYLFKLTGGCGTWDGVERDAMLP